MRLTVVGDDETIESDAQITLATRVKSEGFLTITTFTVIRGTWMILHDAHTVKEIYFQMSILNGHEDTLINALRRITEHK